MLQYLWLGRVCVWMYACMYLYVGVYNTTDNSGVYFSYFPRLFLDHYWANYTMILHYIQNLIYA